MKKIDPEEARRLAKEYYPKGPEKILELMEVKVKYTDTLDSDGWCLRTTNGKKEITNAFININSKSAKPRQRFTLAHELSHLLLGISQTIGESVSVFGKRDTEEERNVDRLAAELLLPESLMLEKVQEIPVTAKAIEALARDAKVSALVVARRIELLYKELSLEGAMMIYYERDKYKYHTSQVLVFDQRQEQAQSYLTRCMSVDPKPYREDFDETKDLVASVIANPGFNTKIVFLQLVNRRDARKILPEERLRELKAVLFKKDAVLAKSIDSRLAAFNVQAQQMNINDAVAIFKRNLFRHPNDELVQENIKILKSPAAAEYFRLKLLNFVRRKAKGS